MNPKIVCTAVVKIVFSILDPVLKSELAYVPVNDTLSTKINFTII